MKKVLFSALLLSVIVVSCSKSSSNTTSATSIVGNWQYTTSIQWTEPKSGAIKKDTGTFGSGSNSYANYLSNGIVYSHIGANSINTTQNQYDTSAYSISGNSINLIDYTAGGRTINGTILTLTDNNLTLYFKTINYDGNGGVIEAWHNLKR